MIKFERQTKKKFFFVLSFAHISLYCKLSMSLQLNVFNVTATTIAITTTIATIITTTTTKYICIQYKNYIKHAHNLVKLTTYNSYTGKNSKNKKSNKYFYSYWVVVVQRATKFVNDSIWSKKKRNVLSANIKWFRLYECNNYNIYSNSNGKHCTKRKHQQQQQQQQQFNSSNSTIRNNTKSKHWAIKVNTFQPLTTATKQPANQPTSQPTYKQTTKRTYRTELNMIKTFLLLLLLLLPDDDERVVSAV